MNTKITRWTAVFSLLAWILSQSSVCHAQGPTINIKDCFSSILVDKTKISSQIDLKYALQEAWSRDLYESAKSGGKLDLIIDDIPIGASYEQATQKIDKQKYQRSEDLNYSAYRSLSRAALNPDAKNIILKCLDNASRGQFGFSYVPWVHQEDPTLITLQMFWNWPSEPIAVTTMRIDGATVEDDGKSHPTKLFGFAALHPMDYNKIGANQSRSVTLKRKNPADSITIIVETVPNIKLPPITIAGEDKPKKCSPIEVKANEFGQPFSKEFGPVDTSTLTFHDANGKTIPMGNGFKWLFEQDLKDAGVDEASTITSVICSKYGTPSDYMDILGANPPWNPVAPGFSEGLKGRCIGWWQNQGRYIKMTINYSRFGYSCPSHDWQQKEGHWQ